MISAAMPTFDAEARDRDDQRRDAGRREPVTRLERRVAAGAGPHRALPRRRAHAAALRARPEQPPAAEQQEAAEADERVRERVVGERLPLHAAEPDPLP